MENKVHESIYDFCYGLLEIEINKYNSFNLSDLSRELDTTRQDTNFIEFIKIMKNRKILFIYEKNKTNHIIVDINKENLLEFIPTLPLNYKFHQFIKVWIGKEIYKYIEEDD